MLHSYCPNSVIIPLSFLWLPSVLQPSKQTFAYEVTATDLASSEVLRLQLSVLNSLLHTRFSVVTQRSFHRRRPCSRLLFKRRANDFLLCRASLLRLSNAHFDTRVDVSLLKVGSSLRTKLKQSGI